MWPTADGFSTDRWERPPMEGHDRTGGLGGGLVTSGRGLPRASHDPAAPHILVVTPDAPDRDLLQALIEAGFTPQRARSIEQMPAALAGRNVTAVLLDVADASALRSIARAVASAGTLPVVVLTHQRDPASAQAMLRAGAAEVLAEDQRDALVDVLWHFQPSAAAAPASPEDRPLPLAAPLASIAAALGAVVLFGWFVLLRGVTTLIPGLPEMKANTAVMFMMLGTAGAPPRPGRARPATPARARARGGT